MALKRIDAKASGNEDRRETLARDLAIEITVGGDRFDRDDLFCFLRGAGAAVGDLASLRERTLELAKDMQPDGHEQKAVDFFNSELDYWLDPDAYGRSLADGLGAREVDEFAGVIAQRAVSGEAEGYGRFDRPFFHQMLVSMGAVPGDMIRIFDAAKEKAVSFHDGVESLDDFNVRTGRTLAWWLDKKVFEAARNGILKDAGVRKTADVQKYRQVDRKVPGLSM